MVNYFIEIQIRFFSDFIDYLMLQHTMY